LQHGSAVRVMVGYTYVYPVRFLARKTSNNRLAICGCRGVDSVKGCSYDESIKSGREPIHSVYDSFFLPIDVHFILIVMSI
jgi:hypothetical protein